MSEAIYKFEPKLISLGGFDRRGCAAALHSATSNAFKVSGLFSDLADFVVLRLFDADDNYGHLFTTRYLPDFDLTNVVVDFDLAITNGMHPASTKFQSVPWGMLSWIKTDGTRGTTALNITSTTGAVAASATFTLAGTPTNFDRVQIVYLGNDLFDMAGLITSGMSLADVAAAIAAQINAATSPTIPLTATHSGPNVTITCSEAGRDGNTIQLVAMYKAAGNTSILPATAKLTGGVDPSFHVTLDFSGMGLTAIRQLWMTLAPSLPIDSGGTNATLVAFTAKEFEYDFSNWTITDSAVKTPLKVAGSGSVLIGSRDRWAVYSGSGWSEQQGFVYHGYARTSSHSGDTVTVKYSCQSTHDLYLGTVLGYGNGTFHVTLDGVSKPDRATALEGALAGDSPISARRLLVSGVAAGTHTIVLTKADASPSWFDYLHAVIASDVADPATTYSAVNAACDYDTNFTYQVAPARLLWNLQMMGFTGDLDFYAGVFFALNRIRVGGSFHQATITLSGTTPGIGNSFGTGSDTLFITLGGVTTGGTAISGSTTTGGSTTGGTAFGIAVYPADTLGTIVQRAIDGLNGLFVGVCAAATGTAGQFTITALSPVNGFALNLAYTATAGSDVTMTVMGDIDAGNEGTWGVDPSPVTGSPAGVPLDRAFIDYLTDLAGLIHAAGQTMTVAFSQELLGPPDVNTSGGAWVQRFADGTPVLTDTGFGSWGAGFVDGVSGSSPITIREDGHGYQTGYTVQIAGAGSGTWSIKVTDANHYELTKLMAGGYTPSVGDAILAHLQTSQCAFNPDTVTLYLAACYVQTAQILAGAGLTPWLQFGEILHWFFSETMVLAIVGFSNSSGLVKVQTGSAHGFSTSQIAIVAGTGLVDGTKTITVIDATHFTVDGSTWPGGSPGAAGTVSGGGMAYYDANQAATAVVSLGRALASFYTQDDDPMVNAGADAGFLAGRIFSHISTIVAAVLAVESTAKFELLYPLDVNLPVAYYSGTRPYPQGGRMNAAVNLPAQFHAKSGSGLDRLKMEGLSWESEYAHHDNFVRTARFPYAELAWSQADTALLIAWDNGTCPWEMAHRFWLNEGIPLVNFWAADHGQLFGWSNVLPVNEPSVS
jgi:hypothetical protein